MILYKLEGYSIEASLYLHIIYERSVEQLRAISLVFLYALSYI